MSNRNLTLQNRNLFWTGGWDSTYRLLEILLIEKRRVQPIYIIDPYRDSIAFELRAMRKIISLLKENYPYVRELLLPTKFVEVSDIKPNKRITDAYHNIIKKQPALGIQNEWLARFTYESDINDIEVAIQKSNRKTYGYGGLIKMLEKTESNNESVIKIREDLKGTDEYYFFKKLRFPVAYITKKEMLEKSKDAGFYNILLHTWFCHHPLPSGKPCGVCVPCYGIMKEGMSFRMPLYSRIRYRFRWLLSKEQFKRTFPRLHGSLKKLKNILKN